MTRDKALEVLEVFLYKQCDLGRTEFAYDANTVWEAVKMANEALEQEPCEDEYIKVPKKALKYRTAGMVAYNVEWLKNHFNMERAVICGEQEPCTDAISRQAVLMEVDKYLCGVPFEEKGIDEVIKELPLVKPTEKVGQWIDAEVLDKIRAEIDEQYDRVHPYNISCAEGLEMALEIIDKYREPTGAEKLGHWRTDKDNSRHWDRIRFYCSECGDWQTYGLTKYCPNCGARMEVQDDQRTGD